MDHKPADASVFWEHRLVAYVWERKGTLHLAGTRATTMEQPEADSALSYADIECFSAERFSNIAALSHQAKSWDSLRFKLELEGYLVCDGHAKPHARLSRF